MVKQEDSNIHVVIRVRPLVEKEITKNDKRTILIDNNLIIAVDPIDEKFREEGKNKLDIYHRSREQKYAFDRVYTHETADDMFEEIGLPLIDEVISGFNACIFAYGATGSGKTFTMLGNAKFDGISKLCLKNIYRKIRNYTTEYDFEITVSYIEIYNEYIRDLLIQQKSGTHQEHLDLRDDNEKGITIAGVTEKKVNNVDEIMELLFAGNTRRTTEATGANAQSSRSHAVLQVSVISKPKTKDIEQEVRLGKLSLIDLAGSERGTVTENRGQRLREGAKINRSLLALANCINALGDKKKKGTFVPYRDSKLTRLLKDSLGGNSKTLMIVNISPASSQFDETLNTLKYANRAKNIKTKPIENKKLVEFHIAEYKNIIEDLRSEINFLKGKCEKEGVNTDGEKNKKGELVKPCKVCVPIPQKEKNDVEYLKGMLIENFDERIQIRKQICEIRAQNYLNLQEIRNGERLMSDVKKGGNIEKEKENIDFLLKSTDFNQSKEEEMKNRLAELSEEAKKLFAEVNARVKSSENRRILDYLIKQQMLELENIEIKVNLQLMEKLNKLLISEISKFKSVLKENNVFSENDNFISNLGQKAKLQNSIDENVTKGNFKKKPNQAIYADQKQDEVPDPYQQNQLPDKVEPRTSNAGARLSQLNTQQQNINKVSQQYSESQGNDVSQYKNIRKSSDTSNSQTTTSQNNNRGKILTTKKSSFQNKPGRKNRD